MSNMMPELMDYYDLEVTKLIVEKYRMSNMDALRRFLISKTHEMLRDTEMGLFEFGPAGIFDMWESEQITHNPRNSVYIRGDAV